MAQACRMEGCCGVGREAMVSDTETHKQVFVLGLRADSVHPCYKKMRRCLSGPFLLAEKEGACVCVSVCTPELAD